MMECHLCGYEQPTLNAVEQHGHGNVDEPALLCDLCYNTNAGNAYLWPNAYHPGVLDNSRVAVQLAHIILDAIAAK